MYDPLTLNGVFIYEAVSGLVINVWQYFFLYSYI